MNEIDLTSSDRSNLYLGIPYTDVSTGTEWDWFCHLLLTLKIADRDFEASPYLKKIVKWLCAQRAILSIRPAVENAGKMLSGLEKKIQVFDTEQVDKAEEALRLADLMVERYFNPFRPSLDRSDLELMDEAMEKRNAVAVLKQLTWDAPKKN